jgi:microcompartment protein CcmK/EutM
MVIARVVGTVVTTISLPEYKDRRLLVVQPLGMPGQAEDGDFLALDSTHAGIGDLVLINREGGSAREVLQNPNAAVISVIVGIIDSIDLPPLDYSPSAAH